METFTQANYHKDMAKLAMNKSLLKEYSYNHYNRVVFLNDNDEFQIQLFNPKSKKIAAKIYINDVALSNMIVLKPGERVWLERYLDKAKKFKFSTYEVDSSAEAQNAIRNNGNIRIKFYDEYRYKVSYSSYDFNKFFKTDNNYLNQKYNHISNDSAINTVRSFCNSVVTNNSTPTMFKGDVNCATMDCYEVKSTALTDCYEVNPTSLTFSANTIETGLIEEGSHSNQKFQNDYTDFESWPFREEVIKILPASQKPYSSDDLNKIYCYNCGRKIKSKFKYCPFCGAKQ